MKIVKQKVNSAFVSHETKIIAEISAGYVFYLGVSETDSEECTSWAIQTIADCLLCHSNFAENQKKMLCSEESLSDHKLSCTGKTNDALILSQFTLLADFKEQKPSFHRAAANGIAFDYFQSVCSQLKQVFPDNVKNGVFGKNLEIFLDIDNSCMPELVENVKCSQ